MRTGTVAFPEGFNGTDSLIPSQHKLLEWLDNRGENVAQDSSCAAADARAAKSPLGQGIPAYSQLFIKVLMIYPEIV